MSRRYDPNVTRILVTLLRQLRGWEREDLAAALGTSRNTIWRYEEKGLSDPQRTLPEIAAAVGLSPQLLDRLLSVVAASWTAVESAADPGNRIKRVEAFASELAADLSELAYDATALVLGDEPDLFSVFPDPEDREEAEELWEALSRHDASARRLLVEESARFQNWALCERICAESRQMESLEEALEAAYLALHIAERVPGHESWRQRLQGYAWAHVAYVYRARGDQAAAQSALEMGRMLWDAGTDGDPGILEEIREWKAEAVRNSS